MANLNSLKFTGTGYLKLPSGTTAQRLAGSVSGQVRYNSSKKEIEVHDGSRWGSAQVQEPTVVTRGLQLHLDSGNLASYPLDGTWYNLAASTGNAVLTATSTLDTGVSFASNSSAGGSVVFDFANGGFTQSVWLKHNAALVAGIQRYFTLASTVEGPVIRLAGPSSLEGYFFDLSRNYRGITIANTVLTGKYYNFVFTYTGSLFTLYANGVSVGQLSGTYTLPTPGTTFSLSPGGGESFYGNMYSVMYYNRALPADEVVQNFNALRGRYGL